MPMVCCPFCTQKQPLLTLYNRHMAVVSVYVIISLSVDYSVNSGQSRSAKTSFTLFHPPNSDAMTLHKTPMPVQIHSLIFILFIFLSF